MGVARIAILVSFIALLAVPLAFRPAGDRIADTDGSGNGGGAAQVIIVSPHNEQIRHEFAVGFDRWHQKKYGQRAQVIWNVPGGTSEIRRMLEAQYRADLEAGKPALGGNNDLVMGGGSYEFGQLKKPVSVDVAVGGAVEKRTTTIIEPVDFDQEWLDSIYGENKIGDGVLYDKDHHWFGVALSGFGIVYNRDSLRDRGLPEPNDWTDLCDPRAFNDVALVNPNQSGSIKTTFEAILQRRGWIEGWRILRRAGGNARYFSGSSLKPPIDVTYGNAALAMCIDFYGRYQAQAMKESGDPDRIGYIDPAGGGTIDADPVAMLRGAPDPVTARRFIEYCLSSEGQSLWQFSRRAKGSDSLMGPETFELRRLPISRAMYRDHFNEFIDKVNPFELATAVKNPNENIRDLIGPVFAAMVMDNHKGLKDAWRAIITHPAYPRGSIGGGDGEAHGGGMVRAEDVSDPTLRKMIELFDSMPEIAAPDGKSVPLGDAARLGEIRNGWVKSKWKDDGLWDPQTGPTDEMRRRFAAFFRERYREIIRLGSGGGAS